MIKYTIGGVITTHVRQWTFPGGEVGIDLQLGSTLHYAYDTPHQMGRIRIDAQLTSSDDVMALMLTVDALRREYPGVGLELTLPYVPYARQDRVVNAGESLSIAVMADMINSCNFIEVTIADPHSAITPALINNVRIIPQLNVFSAIHRNNWDNWVIVAPDQGATKKTEAFAKSLNAKGIIVCDKTRDLHSGKITGMRIIDGADLIEGSNLLVLDDICDGGRTFIELAGLLRPLKPAKLELAVTHGIFSKGVDVVADCYDKVYTTDSLPLPQGLTHPKLVTLTLN